MINTPHSTYEFISTQHNEPIVSRHICNCCTVEFPVFQGDIDLLIKLSPTIAGQNISIPLPQECWHCRERNRLMFRNDSHFYHAICEKSGEKTISRINPARGYHIYTNEAWSGDDRDKYEHGIDFDFSKTFSEQYQDLLRKTPFQNLIGSHSNIKNNATYTNYTADISNSYLVFESDGITESCYCTSCRKSNYLFDCFSCTDCEYCYECTFSKNLYSCLYCESCSDCANCIWSTSCTGCTDCIGCTNLTGKQYYIFNQAHSKEEYFKFLQNLKTQYYNIHTYEEYNQLIKQAPKSATTIINSENSLGDTIFFSNNVRYSYDIINAQSVRYCYDVSYCSDLMDVSSYGSESSLMYYSQGVGRYSNHLYFCVTIGRGENLIYCMDTKKSSDCFACVNVEGLKYAILNKQYKDKEAYEKQVAKIITHMEETGERGKFFEPTISPFPYNDTVANDYYPPAIIQNKDGVIIDTNDAGRGTLTLDSPSQELSTATLNYGGNKVIHTTRRTKETEITIPENCITTKISDIDPSDYYNIDLLKEKILLCELSGRPFTLQKSEIQFYQRFGLSIPHLHPEIRHQQRVLRKPGRNLYMRQCDSTKLPTISVYDDKSGYTIYSNEAYRQEIHG